MISRSVLASHQEPSRLIMCTLHKKSLKQLTGQVSRTPVYDGPAADLTALELAHALRVYLKREPRRCRSARRSALVICRLSCRLAICFSLCSLAHDVSKACRNPCEWQRANKLRIMGTTAQSGIWQSLQCGRKSTVHSALLECDAPQNTSSQLS